MRVIIAAPIVPNVNGGARQIVAWTAEAMRARGHEVEELRLPFPTDFPEIIPALIGMRATPIAESCDRLVTIGWPSHILRHPNKVTWFIHHYRRLFDLWDTPHRAFPDNGEIRSYRAALKRVDEIGLNECHEIFVNSKIMQNRLLQFNGIASEVLYPPLGGDTEGFHLKEYGDFIFYPSRVTPIKRQLLAVEAMRFTKSAVKLVIAGRPEATWYEEALRAAVQQHNLEDKVELRFGWLEQATKLDLLANCLAVAYLPTDEDSYGYISLEASLSHKPIITTTDSGGVPEFVRNGVEGAIVAPDAEALAAAFDAFYFDKQAAQRMGTASWQRMAELNISEDNVIARLLGQEIGQETGGAKS